MLRTAVLVVSMLASACALAGEQVGQVYRVLVRDSLYVFYLYSTPYSSGYGGLPATGKPACASHPYWIVDLARPGAADFKRIVEQALADRGTFLKVTGTGDCGVWPDGETVREIEHLGTCGLGTAGPPGNWTLWCPSP